MGAKSAPGPRHKRFAAYLDGLAEAAGHADRVIPLKNYCTGLLLDGERKSVEPMAARLAPQNVRRMHQSLHHVVADAPWSDEAVLRHVRNSVLPTMQRHGKVVCWIVDDTGFPLAENLYNNCAARGAHFDARRTSGAQGGEIRSFYAGQRDW